MQISVRIDQVRSILPALELLPLEPQGQSMGSNPNAGKMDQIDLVAVYKTISQGEPNWPLTFSMAICKFFLI